MHSWDFFLDFFGLVGGCLLLIDDDAYHLLEMFYCLIIVDLIGVVHKLMKHDWIWGMIC